MGLPVYVRTTETAPPDVAKRRLPAIFKEGNRAAGELWQTKYLPLHFKPFAKSRYGYQQRSTKYLTRKAKRGAVADLVLEGLLKELMTGTRHIVRAFPKRFSIQMFGPSYVGMRPKKASRPNMGAEITKTIASEEKAMGKVYDAAVTKAINAIRATQTTSSK